MSTLKILVKLTDPLEAHPHLEILESHEIEYRLTGLGVDDSSIEHLHIWVDSDDYERASNLIRGNHDYFIKCPKCGSSKVELHHKENLKNSFLGLFKTLLTGSTKYSFNQHICSDCNHTF